MSHSSQQCSASFCRSRQFLLWFHASQGSEWLLLCCCCLCLSWESLTVLVRCDQTPVCLPPQDDEDDTSTSLLGQKKPGYHAPVAILNAIPQSDEQVCVTSLSHVSAHVSFLLQSHSHSSVFRSMTRLQSIAHRRSQSGRTSTKPGADR